MHTKNCGGTERTAEVKRVASRIAAQGAAVYLANSSLMSLLASALVSWSSSSSSSASTLALTSVSICLAVALRLAPVSSPIAMSACVSVQPMGMTAAGLRSSQKRFCEAGAGSRAVSAACRARWCV